VYISVVGGIRKPEGGVSKVVFALQQTQQAQARKDKTLIIVNKASKLSHTQSHKSAIVACDRATAHFSMFWFRIC
jgi:hypothetical protein